MAYTDKYYVKGELDPDPVKRGVLAAFESVYNGMAYFDRVFKMTTDSHVRRFVDDEDYAFWLEQKAMHVA